MGAFKDNIPLQGQNTGQLHIEQVLSFVAGFHTREFFQIGCDKIKEFYRSTFVKFVKA